MMKKIIAICGGSGLLGRAVATALTTRGFQVRLITRAKNKNIGYEQFMWNLVEGYLEPGALENVYGLIQLSGESIAKRRWSVKFKEQLYNSRIDSTRFIIKEINTLTVKPKVFVSASGIGIFGHRPGELLDESSAIGKPSFLVNLCKDWEQEVSLLSSEVRPVIVRIGLVLTPEDGILKQFLLPSRLGLAPVFGSGNQIYSWIHIQDLAGLFCWFIEQELSQGVYHAVAPGPVTERDFVVTLTQLLGPFTLKIPIPQWSMKLALGEFSGALFESQYVLSEKTKKEGFEFKFTRLEHALKDLIF